MTAADNTRYEVLADLLADVDRRATAQGDVLDRLGETVTESTDLLAQMWPRLDTLAAAVGSGPRLAAEEEAAAATNKNETVAKSELAAETQELIRLICSPETR